MPIYAIQADRAIEGSSARLGANDYRELCHRALAKEPPPAPKSAAPAVLSPEICFPPTGSIELVMSNGETKSLRVNSVVFKELMRAWNLMHATLEWTECAPKREEGVWPKTW